VPAFIAEGYLASATTEDLTGWIDRVRRATAEETRVGRRVAYLRSIFVPSDQTCFSLFEAPSAEEVIDTCRLTGIPCDRVRAATLAV
jgi:hypothetical protein